MKTFVVRVKKESYGDMLVQAEDEQDAMNQADEILLNREEDDSIWEKETAEAQDAMEKRC